MQRRLSASICALSDAEPRLGLVGAMFAECPITSATMRGGESKSARNDRRDSTLDYTSTTSEEDDDDDDERPQSCAAHVDERRKGESSGETALLEFALAQLVAAAKSVESWTAPLAFRYAAALGALETRLSTSVVVVAAAPQIRVCAAVCRRDDNRRVFRRAPSPRTLRFASGCARFLSPTRKRVTQPTRSKRRFASSIASLASSRAPSRSPHFSPLRSSSARHLCVRVDDDNRRFSAAEMFAAICNANARRLAAALPAAAKVCSRISAATTRPFAVVATTSSFTSGRTTIVDARRRRVRKFGGCSLCPQLGASITLGEGLTLSFWLRVQPQNVGCGQTCCLHARNPFEMAIADTNGASSCLHNRHLDS